MRCERRDFSCEYLKTPFVRLFPIPYYYKYSPAMLYRAKKRFPVHLPVPLGPKRKNDVLGIFMSRFISAISANSDHICVIYNHFSIIFIFVVFYT